MVKTDTQFFLNIGFLNGIKMGNLLQDMQIHLQEPFKFIMKNDKYHMLMNS